MREIKFRARVKQDGKPYLFYQEDQYLNSFLRRVTSFLAWEKYDENGRHESYLGDHELENCLDQFTGMLDQKGKEIYEGDIVKGMDSVNYPVGPVNWLAGRFRCGDTFIRDFDWGKLEIIGNVWESPELIK